MKTIICRASEVIETIETQQIDAVLSIEHPGAIEGKGRAPRLENISQHILCFWDVEKKNFKDGPARHHVTEALLFLSAHQEGQVIIHCNAGKARSVGIALAWLVSASDRTDSSIQQAIDTIKAIRPIAAPNLAVIEIADDLLGLKGRLTQAVLYDDLFTQNREKAEARREQQMNDPEFLKNFVPEKAPPKFEP
jgi:predicted protein tyrosine phosphatase